MWKMKLRQERDSLAITAKKLGRDYAKVPLLSYLLHILLGMIDYYLWFNYLSLFCSWKHSRDNWCSLWMMRIHRYAHSFLFFFLSTTISSYILICILTANRQHWCQRQRYSKLVRIHAKLFFVFHLRGCLSRQWNDCSLMLFALCRWEFKWLIHPRFFLQQQQPR